MGMSIDEHIKRMGDIRSNYDRWSGLGLTLNEAKAFDFAIDTMRKYQKIEKIWDKWSIDMSVKTNVAMSQIGEVLKDENVD